MENKKPKLSNFDSFEVITFIDKDKIMALGKIKKDIKNPIKIHLSLNMLANALTHLKNLRPDVESITLTIEGHCKPLMISPLNDNETEDFGVIIASLRDI